MSVLFIEYPKCTTCRKAKKFLSEKGINFEDRHIAEEKPNKLELEQWIEKSGLPINKFFNTSGKIYREMGLKDKIKLMGKEELIELLATDGMLVKRPLLITEDKVLVGFKEAEWLELK
ncbi:arsenate reductase family protein [Clostridium sp.]|uniref:arsenate reductase family protein n=1 Tax=Clostridium sp. TaxID=1506 RepID=UPI003F2E9A03